MVKIHNLYNMTYYVHIYDMCNINHMYIQLYNVIITYYYYISKLYNIEF